MQSRNPRRGGKESDDTDKSYKIEDHKPQKLHVGDRVEARWQGKPTGRYLPGKIHAIYLKSNPYKKLDHDEVSDLALSPYLYDISFDPMPYDPDETVWSTGDPKEKRGSALTRSAQMWETEPAEGIPRSRICKVTEVIQLSTVLKHKSEFDGLAEAFRFLMYVLLCALIPIMFIDPGGPACRSEVNEALASYEDSYGVVNYKADNYNLVDMTSYIIGLMDSLISNSEDGDYEGQRIVVGDTKVHAFANRLLLEMTDDAYGGAEQKRAAWQVLCNNSNYHIKQNVYCQDEVETLTKGFLPADTNLFVTLIPYHAPHNLSTAREFIDVLKNEIMPVVIPGLTHQLFYALYQCDITPVGYHL